jgi:hypothetical protein
MWECFAGHLLPASNTTSNTNGPHKIRALIKTRAPGEYYTQSAGEDNYNMNGFYNICRRRAGFVTIW